MLRVRSSPNAKQQTTTKGDDVNPVWNETFTFYLNPEKKNKLGTTERFYFIHATKHVLFICFCFIIFLVFFSHHFSVLHHYHLGLLHHFACSFVFFVFFVFSLRLFCIFFTLSTFIFSFAFPLSSCSLSSVISSL